MNWSRETAVLMRVEVPEGQPPTFQLSMTKRRKRAGLRDVNGDLADTIFLRHSGHDGICVVVEIAGLVKGKSGLVHESPGDDLRLLKLLPVGWIIGAIVFCIVFSHGKQFILQQHFPDQL